MTTHKFCGGLHEDFYGGSLWYVQAICSLERILHPPQKVPIDAHLGTVTGMKGGLSLIHCQYSYIPWQKGIQAWKERRRKRSATIPMSHLLPGMYARICSPCSCKVYLLFEKDSQRLFYGVGDSGSIWLTLPAGIFRTVISNLYCIPRH